jgi:FAD binding domain/Berberine and berberine like
MLMSTTITAADAARRELKDFGGELVGPDDPGYEDARTIYNAWIDRRPALIARCASPEDVARTIGFARAHELRLAVRGGGHNGGGLGTVEGGVVCDLSLLNEVTVDPVARTASVGGGCTWGEVDKATQEHGLAVPCGIISTTGVGGLTLGGGIGHLTRKYGLSIDNLLGADLVTADGEQVRANADENPDLYWAIRGGGGNFGAVTRFHFRANPAGTVIAGPTFWPIEQAAEVLSVYRDFIGEAPRELNGFFAFHYVPPGPPFPEEIHRRHVCGVVWNYLGSEDELAKLLAPILAVGTPILHGVHEMPFAALNGAFDGLYPAGDQWYWRADFVNEISDEAVERHVEWGEKLPTLKSTMHMYPIDGAAHDVGSGDTAWSYREAQWGSVMAGVDPDPAKKGVIRDWSVGYWEALHPFSAGGAYVNMMMDDEGGDRVKASYRDNYDRLARVKGAYDPENVFRVNQNIKPA